jgi:hypothetical protein
VDHELRRDVLLDTGLIYRSDDYVGIGFAERTDTTYDLFLGATYLTNRNLHVSLSYHYLQQLSDDNTVTPTTANEFEKNLVLVQVRTQL